ncbi:MAG: PrsW family glutamic-type intramembrane protease [Nibricoccus sp.]
MPSTSRWKKFLSHASRSRSFLWKLAIGIILSGVAIGCLIHHLRPSGPSRLAEHILGSIQIPDGYGPAAPAMDNLHASVLLALDEELSAPGVHFSHLVQALPPLAPLLGENPGKTRRILEKHFSPDEALLASDFIALHSGDSALQKSAEQRLKTLASGEAPPRFVHHLLGVHEQSQGNDQQAAKHFIQEGRHPEAVASRAQAVQSLIAGKKFTELDQLTREDPRYAELISASDRLEIAVAQKDWRAILKWTPLSQIEIQHRGLLALTLITGLAWGFFLFHLGQTEKFFSSTTALCVAGFILGAVSTTPTILAVIWQDDFLGFSRTGNSFQILAYNVGGIGLREEVCKLLLFLPLLPFLLRRDDEREALLVASFVGLGFAIEENGSYFLGSQGIDGPGRFLTANFLHIVLTGMNGLALFRACAHGGRGINEFLTVFPLTVLVHGLYDGLSDVPELMEIGGYLAITLYVVSSILYFHRAYELRENLRMTISLTGAFILGLSVVTAVVLIEQISAIGPGPGLTRIVPEFIGVGVLILMFTRTFNEGLSE